MKKEILKILVWFSAAFLIYILYEIFISILYKNWAETTSFFEGVIKHPEQIIVFFIPYLSYKIISLIFQLINRLFSRSLNCNKIPFKVVISICLLLLIKMVSENLILYGYYKNSFSGFVPEKNSLQIDSTNYKDFIWTRKSFTHDGLYFFKDKLWFTNDTTVTISTRAFSTPDDLLKSDLLFLYLLNKYEIDSTDKYLFKDGKIFVAKITYNLKFNNGKLETDFY